MAIKKLSGGLEDLAMGMGTVPQLRKGKEVDITEINSSNIPYSSTQSIKQKVDQNQSVDTALRNDLDAHKARTDNPHNIQPEELNAAPLVHTHNMVDVTGLQDALDEKAFVIHEHTIAQVTGLQTELDSKMENADVYIKTDYIDESAGVTDAGKPIVLTNEGKLHTTLTGSGLYPVGMYTPDATTEYPDATGEDTGAYWGVFADEVNGYTFVAGDLAGETIFPNDSVILGSTGWGLFIAPTGSQDFYRLDGTIAISGAFAGGGQQFKNAAPATENGDLVEYSQIGSFATDFMSLDGTSPMEANLDMSTFRLVGVGDAVDNTDSINKGQLTAHTSLVDNPHAVTKAQVGLTSVDDTSDASKPISTATQTALDLKVDDTQVLTDVPAGALFTDNDTIYDDTSVVAHIADVANPHAVTAAQVGAEPAVALGTAGQVWATNPTADAKEWVDMPTGGGGSDIPIGGIIMYSGLLANVPLDWLLCDGANGTPDMTSSFVMGTIVEAEIGVTGGSADSVAVAHGHTASSSSNFSGDGLFPHGHTGATEFSGGHYHEHQGFYQVQSGTDRECRSRHQVPTDLTDTSTCVSVLDHSHGVSVDAISAGVPSGSVSTSTSIDDAGVPGTGLNLPPYVRLAYIMKVA